MTTLAASNGSPLARLASRLRDFWQDLWALNKPLALASAAGLALAVVTVAGLVLDPRVITGAPAWLKPMKFAISTVFYCGTLAWLLGFVQGHRRLVALVSVATTLGLFVELAIIVAQVARGRSSHFNVSTPLEGTLWSLMAGFIVLVWTMNLVTAGLLLRQRLPDAALAWSLRLGVVISTAGMGLAFLMTSPTPAQLAAMQAGQAATNFGAHSVGVADGGPGLPIVGWSTIGGDLRAAHFVGLHGLQVLPLLGVALRRVKRLMDRQRLGLVWVAGLGYLSLTGLLAWQALRGQSIIAPDALTLAVLGTLLAAVVGASALIVAWPQRARVTVQA